MYLYRKNYWDEILECIPLYHGKGFSRFEPSWSHVNMDRGSSNKNKPWWKKNNREDYKNSDTGLLFTNAVVLILISPQIEKVSDGQA